MSEKRNPNTAKSRLRTKTEKSGVAPPSLNTAADGPDGPRGGAQGREARNRLPEDYVLPTVCRRTISAVKPPNHVQRASSHDGKIAAGSKWLALLKSGHFGTPAEKRLFLIASQRFKILLTGTRSPFRRGSNELSEISDILDQREIWDVLDGIDFNDILTKYYGPEERSLSGKEPNDSKSWNTNSFADSVLIAHSVVHGATENPHRDLPLPLYRMQRDKVLELAKRNLGATGFKVLKGVICEDDSCAFVGREQMQFTGSSPANASSAGTGQIRAELLHLVEFFVFLDRLESGALSVEQCRESLLWDLASRQMPAGEYVWCGGWCYTTY